MTCAGSEVPKIVRSLLDAIEDAHNDSSCKISPPWQMIDDMFIKVQLLKKVLLKPSRIPLNAVLAETADAHSLPKFSGYTDTITAETFKRVNNEKSYCP